MQVVKKMSKLTIYSFAMVINTLISSLSQIILKKSAQKKYDSKIKEYLNPLVIFAYILVFSCTLISVYVLKVVPLSMAPILEASGYIFIAILSYFFFNEKLTKEQMLGMMLIISGIVIYSI